MAAATAPGIAAYDSFDSEPATEQKAMLLQGFNGVMRARRSEAANISNERGNTPLIDFD